MRALLLATVFSCVSFAASAQGLTAEQEAGFDAIWDHGSELRDRSARVFYDWKTDNEVTYEAAIKEVWCAERSLSFARFSEGETDQIAYWEQRIEKAQSALSTLVKSLNSAAYSNARDLEIADTVLISHMVDLEHEGFMLGLRTGLRMDHEARPFPGLCW